MSQPQTNKFDKFCRLLNCKSGKYIAQIQADKTQAKSFKGSFEQEVTHFHYVSRKHKTRLWFQIFFGIFTPKIGEDEPILTSIFFRWVGSTTR